MWFIYLLAGELNIRSLLLLKNLRYILIETGLLLIEFVFVMSACGSRKVHIVVSEVMYPHFGRVEGFS